MSASEGGGASQVTEAHPAAEQGPARLKDKKKRTEKGAAADKLKPAATRCGCADQQKRRNKEFAQHKAHILANLGSNACDFSPKGSVDIKCHAIMDILNTHTDYVTTSSCSGRIALFHSIQSSGDDNDDSKTASRMKRGDAGALGWLLVKHGVLLPREMLLVVRYLCGDPSSDDERKLDEGKVAQWEAHVAGHEGDEPYHGELEGTLFTGDGSCGGGAALGCPPTVGTVTLKMEPFVMHVECRTMDSAKELLSAAVSDSGYRNSGVVPPGKKIMCGIRSATGLGMEVPLVVGGQNYVRRHGQRAYVWALLELANDKMHANEVKTALLTRSVAKRVAALTEAASA